MNTLSSRTAALVLCCILLQACGTKGPLYLPKPDARPAANPTEAEQQRK